MSNGNYQETHERILKSGLAAFLEEGFEKANLRRICKAAGVTTGAFYKHFKDKEALFSELVEPLASMIRKAYAQGEERGFAGYDEGKPVTPEQVRAALEAKAAGTLATTAMLYSHRDIYELLVFRSYGTPYEHFLDWLVDEEDKDHPPRSRADPRRREGSNRHLERVSPHRQPRVLQRPFREYHPREERRGAQRDDRGHFNVLQCGLGEISHALTTLSFFCRQR